MAFGELLILLWKRHSVNLYALLLLIFGMGFNTIAISFAHERVPVQLKPLPDIMFDILFYTPNMIAICEFYITAQNVALLILLFLHPEREIIFRRYCIITSIAYLFRTICFTSTTLPPSFTYFCEPKLNNSLTAVQFVQKICTRAFFFSLTFGMATQKRVSLCGDQIYSGHTLCIIVVHLFIYIYFYRLHCLQNKLISRVVKKVHLGLSIASIMGLLMARQHYTIDVVLSCYVCTQIFFTYHGLCLDKQMFAELKRRYNYPSIDYNELIGHFEIQNDQITILDRQVGPPKPIKDYRNLISNFWWWPLFEYFELKHQIPHTIVDDDDEDDVDADADADASAMNLENTGEEEIFTV